MTVILGTTIVQTDTEKQKKVVESIARFTYHKNFPPLENKMTTDKNWGCCIRCGQSLMIQFIAKLYKHYGKEVTKKFPTNNHHELFFDKTDRPFGIHNICSQLSELGNKPGEWVKPSIIAPVFKNILEIYGIKTVIADNGILSLEILREALSSNDPILLLFPLMLGFEEFDLKYLDFLKLTLSLPCQSIGVIGGQQGKAFYFVGHQKENLLYFDPHEVTDPVMKTEDIHFLYKAPLKKMLASQISSSVLVGFFITNTNDAAELPMLLSASGVCPIQIVERIEHAQTNRNIEDGWDVVTN